MAALCKPQTARCVSRRIHNGLTRRLRRRPIFVTDGERRKLFGLIFFLDLQATPTSGLAFPWRRPSPLRFMQVLDFSAVLDGQPSGKYH